MKDEPTKEMPKGEKTGEDILLTLMTDVELKPKSKPHFSQQFFQQFAEALKHPFAILMSGALITYLLVPYLNAEINYKQLLRETKLKKAIEIGDHNREFNSTFNGLLTMLSQFHNDTARLRLNPSELRAAKLNFRNDFERKYLDFDEKAWWWYTDLEREASVLDLVPSSELTQLKSETREYGQNVVKTKNILQVLWETMIADDYDPNNEESKKKVDDIIVGLRNQQGGLPALSRERNELIKKITKHFTIP